MSSRFTINTNILKIRDVFVLDPKTDEFLETGYFPVIQDDAKLTWVEPFSFIGGISCLNTTAGDLMYSIQPGFSTLSTSFTLERDTILENMIANLGSAGYVSTSTELSIITELTATFSYISSTLLYDCIESLVKLDNITNYMGSMAMFLGGAFSNYPAYGYVKTVNPGQYTTYYSTLGFSGNLSNIPISINPVESIFIDIGGYSTNMLQASKMKIDIIGSANITYTNPPQEQSVVTNFSSFLYNGTRPIGTPVVMNYSNANYTAPGFTYLLNNSDLYPFPTQLTLQHRISNIDSTFANITTSFQGIHMRLINKD
jgi:hypothetical protein